MLRVATSFICLILLAACQTASLKPQFDVNQFLHDDLFPNYHTRTIETAEEIFALSPEMITFMESEVMPAQTANEKMRALVKGIFKHPDVSILYQNQANTIAANTFNNRMANCLSLTIMTYALAEYANLGVDFQQVDVPELWVLRDGTNMLNKHVNLKMYRKREASVVTENGEKFVVWNFSRNYTVDFDQRIGNSKFPRRVISKERVLALFYNNNGVDALLEGDNEKAYAYFKEAMLIDNSLMDSYTNLGVLYRRMGHNDKAEQNYNYALRLAPGDHTVLDNLASLYRVTGRVEEADEIVARLERKRQDNPYYHYLLGQRALESNDPLSAKTHFQRAIRLLSENHEFYYAMAKTHYLLGNKEASHRYMLLAKKHSPSEADETRYQFKIDSLA